MLEQILVPPDWRLVVLEEIPTSPGRVKKYVVELNGLVRTMSEFELNQWRAKSRPPAE